MPEAPHRDSEWTVAVVDDAGEPLEIDGAGVRLIARTRPEVVRVPGPHEVALGRGRVVVRGLQPGRWELRVDVASSLGGHVEWTVERPRSTQRSRLVVRTFEAGVLSVALVELATDGLPWVDPNSALVRAQGAPRVGLGTHVSDARFEASLRTGFGPVRAAELVLDLRGLANGPRNDTLSLQASPSDGYAWRSGLAELVPGGWGSGESARVRLDLARLPGPGGRTVDLLPLLADGTLDVAVQDDTAVDALLLRLVR
jgi:hypothetical protein